MSSLVRKATRDVIVVGAGLAGLTCARDLGDRALLLEQEAAPGGLARSFQRDGFCFDMTGHWLHLASARVRELVLAVLSDELVEIERRAAVQLLGVRTRYPFQAHTYGLPPAVIAECVLGYFSARERAAAGVPALTSFEDFIRLRLGDGIARHFMLPYNTKLWTVSPAEMDWAWCERFVPTPAPEEVVLGALRPEGAGHALGYNTRFFYPRRGGIGALTERLRATYAGELRLGATVRGVDWRARAVILADGTRLTYQRLVSTMPLKALAAALIDAPEAVTAAAAQLRAASVTYWDIGLPAPNGADDPHWVYFPEPAVPFYRTGAPSAVLPTLAPAGCRSLYVEVSHPQGTPTPVRDEEILAALRAVALLGKHEEPLQLNRRCIDCGYVIMDRRFAAARALILDWLATQGILSIGRYGAWTYDSMEGAMQQGLHAAQRLRDGFGAA